MGQVIPAAERALESGSPAPLEDALCGIVRDRVGHLHARAMEFKEHAGEDVPSARSYVEAMLGLQVWAHAVYRQALAGPHAHAAVHEHE